MAEPVGVSKEQIGVRLPVGAVVRSERPDRPGSYWRGASARRYAEAFARAQGGTVVTRTVTSYADQVTDWEPAADPISPPEKSGA